MNASQYNALINKAKHVAFCILRWAFRRTPMPVAVRDRVRQRVLERHASLVPNGPRGRFDVRRSGHRHLPTGRAGQRAIGYVGYRKEPLPATLPATVVAFYLPQFHPIAENDGWWGKGFTEWTNVTRALPQFEGHIQPRLPGELGFYDLRLSEVMREQMRLAQEYGVSAFCLYYYWFAGKRLLEAPIENWLADQSLTLPLCLCWANENWSRRWDGRADEILIAQEHSADDDIAFISHVSRYLTDPRYLRVDGRPLLLVYRPFLLPDARATARRWRDWCAENGVGEIMLAYVQGFERPNPVDIGFDAAIEFPPNMSSPTNVTARQQLVNPNFEGQVLDWRDLARQSATRKPAGYPLFPAVNPGWDNEPRRTGRGTVFVHASPRGYRDWLATAIRSRLPALPESQQFIFVNAWNEWAEGSVLEPDARLGYAWLQATRDALCSASGEQTTPARNDKRPCVILHAWHPELLTEFIEALHKAFTNLRLVVTTSELQKAKVDKHLKRTGMPYELHVFENRGRDILPFLHVADQLLQDGEDIVLKLHTKRSLHRSDGDQWRTDLLRSLLSPERAQGLLQAMAQQPTLGIIAADGHILRLSDFWGANRDSVEYLCTRLGLSAPNTDDRFVAGSMFWIRLEALRPLLDAHLDLWEFELEQGQVDGTMAHAVERLTAKCCSHAGYEIRSAAAICGQPEPAGRFPYAD